MNTVELRPNRNKCPLFTCKVFSNAVETASGEILSNRPELSLRMGGLQEREKEVQTCLVNIGVGRWFGLPDQSNGLLLC